MHRSPGIQALTLGLGLAAAAVVGPASSPGVVEGDATLCRAEAAGSGGRWRPGRASLRIPRLASGDHALEAEASRGGSRRGFFRIQRKQLEIVLRPTPPSAPIDQQALGIR